MKILKSSTFFFAIFVNFTIYFQIRVFLFPCFFPFLNYPNFFNIYRSTVSDFGVKRATLYETVDERPSSPTRRLGESSSFPDEPSSAQA